MGWMIAGTLDILYAVGFSYARSGVAPARVLQSVAAGGFGSAAFEGGAAMAVAGLGFHYLNALLITIAFFAAAAVAPALRRRPVLIGAVYGVLVYLLMNYVVIPLSRIGVFPSPPTAIWVTGVLVHMFFIGVPIALAARQAFDDPGVSAVATNDSMSRYSRQ
jgi:uncharacterized membrane protein YagU involved in acid resistance